MRKKTALLVAAFVLVIITLLVIVVTIQIKPSEPSVIKRFYSMIFDRKKQYGTSKYKINKQSVTFEFNADLNFPIPHFQYSTAFQNYLDSIAFTMSPITNNKINRNVPTKIIINVTDKFKNVGNLILDQQGNITSSMSNTYDKPTQTVTINIFLTEYAFHSVLRPPLDKKILLGKHILEGVAQYDEGSLNYNAGEKISDYMKADSYTQLLP